MADSLSVLAYTQLCSLALLAGSPPTPNILPATTNYHTNWLLKYIKINISKLCRVIKFVYFRIMQILHALAFSSCRYHFNNNNNIFKIFI